ncbi:MAG: glutamate--tRNA ligase [Patescibacteria group bacterium]
MVVRVRFAPSPTGSLHLGTVRTALFNWLFARHEGGKFLLRIEDTDTTRSKKEYEEGIFKSLEWLGLDWDEKEVRQSDRIAVYRKFLQKLIDERKAYYCFCTEEELEAEQQAQLSQGLSPKYSGRCRALSSEAAEEKHATMPAVIRFRVPDKKIAFTDLVRGKTEFNVALSGDFIIAKSLTEPLYNFAVVVDDEEMEISHVIRGEDHLSNTPKQIALQEALGFKIPHYAHLPLILGLDKKKLSKRFVSTSIDTYRNGGYLPESILNFLVLLGWHPLVDREVISIAEMVKEFEIKRVQKSGGVFNEEKLNWLNGYYIKHLPIENLIHHLAPFLPPEWLYKKAFVKKVLKVERERMRTLSDFVSLAKMFFELPSYTGALLAWKGSEPAKTAEMMRGARDILQDVPEHDFSKEKLTAVLMPFAEAKGRGDVLWPLRVALSGSEASPGPVELLDILGKDESLRRIDQALLKLTV